MAGGGPGAAAVEGEELVSGKGISFLLQYFLSSKELWAFLLPCITSMA